jgi:hypothetical protein
MFGAAQGTGMTAGNEGDKPAAGGTGEILRPKPQEEAPTAEIDMAALMRLFDNLGAEFKAIADIMKSLGDKA